MHKQLLFFFAVIGAVTIIPNRAVAIHTITTNTTINDSDAWYGWDNRVEIRSNPTVNMIGGHADFIHTYDTSFLKMSGGEIQRFRSYGTSILNIDDHGYISVFAVTWDSSHLNMTGGTINSSFSRSTSSVEISGGLVLELNIQDSSNAHVNGGTLGSVVTKDHGEVHLFGGDIGSVSAVTTYDEGGSLIGSGDIYLYGENLFSTYTGGLYGYGYASGLWENGTAFNVDFKNVDTYSYVILVPESTTFALLTLGTLALRLKRSR